MTSESPTVENNNNSSSNDDALGRKEQRDKHAEAMGGAFRGASHSFGRSIATRLPIGQLPRPKINLTTTKLPAKQIATLSDRVSTGLDAYYHWSNESSSNSNNDNNNSSSKINSKQVSNVVKGLVKGTFLGMAVFETYGYIVSALAPPLVDDKDKDNSSVRTRIKLDEYARASLPTHIGAGFCAGAVHGVLDGGLLNRLPLSKFTGNVLHHSLAHSILFGTYEGSKRLLLLEDKRSKQDGFLLRIAAAGGFAGQFQHVVSHYSEAILIDKIPWQKLSAPTWRSIAWAFPGTAVGFVAFEFGKLSSDD